MLFAKQSGFQTRLRQAFWVTYQATENDDEENAQDAGHYYLCGITFSLLCHFASKGTEKKRDDQVPRLYLDIFVWVSADACNLVHAYAHHCEIVVRLGTIAMLTDSFNHWFNDLLGWGELGPSQ